MDLRKRRTAALLLLTFGAALVVTGVALVAVPAALVVAGLYVGGFALLAIDVERAS
jgi:hypothetical protein